MTRGTGSTTGRAGGAAEGAKAVATRRGKPGKRGEELRQALVIELHTLRLQAQDAVEQYALRVNSQLAEVLRARLGGGPVGVAPLPPAVSPALPWELEARPMAG